MKNEIKIEVETDDGQIYWKHYRFPRWKLTSIWAKGFLKLIAKLLKTSNTKQAKPIPNQAKPVPKQVKPIPKQDPQDQNPLMRIEAEAVLQNLGVRKKRRKKLLDRAGSCKDVEEMVRKCLETAA